MSDVLVEELETLEILEVAEQGPPGPPGASESSPVMTYVGGVLTRVDYASGNYKLMTYGVTGLLTQVDYVKGAVTTRKTFAYNPDGSLASVTESNL